MSDAAICYCLTGGGVKSSCKDGRTGSTAEEAHFWAPRRVAADRFASIYRDFVRICSLSTIIVAQVAIAAPSHSADGLPAAEVLAAAPPEDSLAQHIAGSIPVPIIREKRHTSSGGAELFRSR